MMGTRDIQTRILSRQLRLADHPRLAKRRGIVGLSLGAIGCMSVVLLYQMGIVRRLPEPDLPGLDGEKVDASPEAYRWFRTPDAALDIGSYAATLGLAAAGDKDRATNAPWIPLAMFAKTWVDALQAGKLTFDQFSKHRAACMWCLLAAGASFASAALAVPEAKMAIREVQRRI